MHPLLIAARLVVRDMGGADQAARHLGKSGSTLAHEIDPNYPSAKLGLLDAATLSAAASDARIASAFAAECGGVYLQLPQAASEADDDTMRHITALVGEFGDVLREVSSAAADGCVTDNELDRVQREAVEVIAGLQRLLVHLAQRNQAAKPLLRRAA